MPSDSRESVQQTMDSGQPNTDKQPERLDGDLSAFPPGMKIPKALRDLMIEHNVCEWDIQNVVAAKGYYPEDTPIENYDPEFVSGVPGRSMAAGFWNDQRNERKRSNTI